MMQTNLQKMVAESLSKGTFSLATIYVSSDRSVPEPLHIISASAPALLPEALRAVPPNKVEPAPTPKTPELPYTSPPGEVMQASASALAGGGASVAAEFLRGRETGATGQHIKVELPTTQPVPPIAVEAAKGEGYDTMIKRIWVDVQGKGMNPNMYPVGSDLHRLLIADERSIDRVARLIAADPKHQLFGAPSAGLVLELRADGNLHVLAPGEAPVAPPVAHVEVRPTAESPALTPPPPLETLTAAIPSPTTPEAVPQPPVATPEHLETFTNSHGVTVDPTKAAVYLDVGGATVVYGGKEPAEWLKAATAYAKAHKGTTVWVQAGSPIPYRGAMHLWAYPVIDHGLFHGGMEVAEELLDPDHQLGRVTPDRFKERLI